MFPRQKTPGRRSDALIAGTAVELLAARLRASQLSTITSAVKGSKQKSPQQTGTVQSTPPSTGQETSSQAVLVRSDDEREPHTVYTFSPEQLLRAARCLDGPPQRNESCAAVAQDAARPCVRDTSTTPEPQTYPGVVPRQWTPPRQKQPEPQCLQQYSRQRTAQHTQPAMAAKVPPSKSPRKPSKSTPKATTRGVSAVDNDRSGVAAAVAGQPGSAAVPRHRALGQAKGPADKITAASSAQHKAVASPTSAQQDRGSRSMLAAEDATATVVRRSSVQDSAGHTCKTAQGAVVAQQPTAQEVRQGMPVAIEPPPQSTQQVCLNTSWPADPCQEPLMNAAVQQHDTLQQPHQLRPQQHMQSAPAEPQTQQQDSSQELLLQQVQQPHCQQVHATYEQPQQQQLLSPRPLPQSLSPRAKRLLDFSRQLQQQGAQQQQQHLQQVQQPHHQQQPQTAYSGMLVPYGDQLRPQQQQQQQGCEHLGIKQHNPQAQQLLQLHSPGTQLLPRQEQCDQLNSAPPQQEPQISEGGQQQETGTSGMCKAPGQPQQHLPTVANDTMQEQRILLAASCAQQQQRDTQQACHAAGSVAVEAQQSLDAGQHEHQLPALLKSLSPKQQQQHINQTSPPIHVQQHSQQRVASAAAGSSPLDRQRLLLAQLCAKHRLPLPQQTSLQQQRRQQHWQKVEEQQQLLPGRQMHLRRKELLQQLHSSSNAPLGAGSQTQQDCTASLAAAAGVAVTGLAADGGTKSARNRMQSPARHRRSCMRSTHKISNQLISTDDPVVSSGSQHVHSMLESITFPCGSPGKCALAAAAAAAVPKAAAGQLKSGAVDTACWDALAQLHAAAAAAGVKEQHAGISCVAEQQPQQQHMAAAMPVQDAMALWGLALPSAMANGQSTNKMLLCDLTKQYTAAAAAAQRHQQLTTAEQRPGTAPSEQQQQQHQQQFSCRSLHLLMLHALSVICSERRSWLQRQQSNIWQHLKQVQKFLLQQHALAQHNRSHSKATSTANPSASPPHKPPFTAASAASGSCRSSNRYLNQHQKQQQQQQQQGLGVRALQQNPTPAVNPKPAAVSAAVLTKRLSNDAAILRGKVDIAGTLVGWEGSEIALKLLTILHKQLWATLVIQVLQGAVTVAADLEVLLQHQQPKAAQQLCTAAAFAAWHTQTVVTNQSRRKCHTAVEALRKLKLRQCVGGWLAAARSATAAAAAVQVIQQQRRSILLVQCFRSWRSILAQQQYRSAQNAVALLWHARMVCARVLYTWAAAAERAAAIKAAADGSSRDGRQLFQGCSIGLAAPRLKEWKDSALAAMAAAGGKLAAAHAAVAAAVFECRARLPAVATAAAELQQQWQQQRVERAEVNLQLHLQQQEQEELLQQQQQREPSVSVTRSDSSSSSSDGDSNQQEQQHEQARVSAEETEQQQSQQLQQLPGGSAELNSSSSQPLSPVQGKIATQALRWAANKLGSSQADVQLYSPQRQQVAIHSAGQAATGGPASTSGGRMSPLHFSRHAEKQAGGAKGSHSKHSQQQLQVASLSTEEQLLSLDHVQVQLHEDGIGSSSTGCSPVNINQHAKHAEGPRSQPGTCNLTVDEHTGGQPGVMRPQDVASSALLPGVHDEAHTATTGRHTLDSRPPAAAAASEAAADDMAAAAGLPSQVGLFDVTVSEQNSSDHAVAGSIEFSQIAHPGPPPPPGVLLVHSPAGLPAGVHTILQQHSHNATTNTAAAAAASSGGGAHSPAAAHGPVALSPTAWHQASRRVSQAIVNYAGRSLCKKACKGWQQQLAAVRDDLAAAREYHNGVLILKCVLGWEEVVTDERVAQEARLLRHYFKRWLSFIKHRQYKQQVTAAAVQHSRQHRLSSVLSDWKAYTTLNQLLQQLLLLFKQRRQHGLFLGWQAAAARARVNSQLLQQARFKRILKVFRMWRHQAAATTHAARAVTSQQRITLRRCFDHWLWPVRGRALLTRVFTNAEQAWNVRAKELAVSNHPDAVHAATYQTLQLALQCWLEFTSAQLSEAVARAAAATATAFHRTRSLARAWHSWQLLLAAAAEQRRQHAVAACSFGCWLQHVRVQKHNGSSLVCLRKQLRRAVQSTRFPSCRTEQQWYCCRLVARTFAAWADRVLHIPRQHHRQQLLAKGLQALQTSAHQTLLLLLPFWDKWQWQRLLRKALVLWHGLVLLLRQQRQEAAAIDRWRSSRVALQAFTVWQESTLLGAAKRQRYAHAYAHYDRSLMGRMLCRWGLVICASSAARVYYQQRLLRKTLMRWKRAVVAVQLAIAEAAALQQQVEQLKLLAVVDGAELRHYGSGDFAAHQQQQQPQQQLVDDRAKQQTVAGDFPAAAATCITGHRQQPQQQEPGSMLPAYGCPYYEVWKQEDQQTYSSHLHAAAEVGTQTEAAATAAAAMLAGYRPCVAGTQACAVGRQGMHHRPHITDAMVDCTNTLQATQALKTAAQAGLRTGLHHSQGCRRKAATVCSTTAPRF